MAVINVQYYLHLIALTSISKDITKILIWFKTVINITILKQSKLDAKMPIYMHSFKIRKKVPLLFFAACNSHWSITCIDNKFVFTHTWLNQFYLKEKKTTCICTLIVISKMDMSFSIQYTNWKFHCELITHYP